ncbi:diacylglycerol/lipid kinase family protein [Holdemanella biformis]|jgi:diacylglycerol kinase (ATP)|uniref:diacylglycerol/lipid kinase family protein n=1 Tax=Holdemanella biformis TaxID=1735 RepID=UPI001C382E7C|nr:YegS/Rv2252/BmrU family lipid kinase [Holdemanella biformis]MBV4132006.1 YegS/Rv2252/BmrU family lipid kinase [Holdemanella biformis]MBV4151757.1 YegS/Rv2252/BmrU family lipid kinase [Holdemanella biformis]
MNRKKVLVLINPNSGKKNSKESVLEALNVFSANNYQMEIYLSQKPMDVTHYIEENGKRFDVVAVFGGDGTLNEATNGLMKLKHKPVISYFPTGTMNDFGTNFGLTNDMKQCANIACVGHIESFDVGKINSRYFNYVAGFGAFCNVSYETKQELKKQIGNMAYIIKALHEIPNLHPYHVKMNLDGKVFEKDLMFGLIINGNRVAGFEMVEQADNTFKDGLFDIILVEHTPNLLELYNYPLGVLHPELNMKYVERYQAKSIIIESQEKLAWTLDGEEGEETLVARVENISQALQIYASN